MGDDGSQTQREVVRSLKMSICHDCFKVPPIAIYGVLQFFLFQILNPMFFLKYKITLLTIDI